MCPAAACQATLVSLGLLYLQLSFQCHFALAVIFKSAILSPKVWASQETQSLKQIYYSSEHLIRLTNWISTAEVSQEPQQLPMVPNSMKWWFLT